MLGNHVKNLKMRWFLALFRRYIGNLSYHITFKKSHFWKFEKKIWNRKSVGKPLSFRLFENVFGALVPLVGLGTNTVWYPESEWRVTMKPSHYVDWRVTVTQCWAIRSDFISDPKILISIWSDQIRWGFQLVFLIFIWWSQKLLYLLYFSCVDVRFLRIRHTKGSRIIQVG